MSQDYNSTLNLPKTDFPMRAGLPQSEPVQGRDRGIGPARVPSRAGASARCIAAPAKRGFHPGRAECQDPDHPSAGDSRSAVCRSGPPDRGVGHDLCREPSRADHRRRALPDCDTECRW